MYKFEGEREEGKKLGPFIAEFKGDSVRAVIQVSSEVQYNEGNCFTPSQDVA